MMCGAPLLILTLNNRVRPLCPACEQKVNEKVAKSMSARGKDIRNKKVVFAKVPEVQF